jgi:hypothetical protein
LRGRVRVGERHRRNPGEALGVVGGPFRQGVVEHAVPGDALFARQAVGEDVRPGADDLMIDALLIEPLVALGHRFDKAREKRPHLEAVAELQRLLAALGRRERDADLLALVLDCGDEMRRDVMGMRVDRHFFFS